MHVITLRAGDAAVELAPEAGGAVTRYWLARGAATREWLRPTPAGALRDGGPDLAAALPLVPHSNPIREGRFSFPGPAGVQPLNSPPERPAVPRPRLQARLEAADVPSSD